MINPRHYAKLSANHPYSITPIFKTLKISALLFTDKALIKDNRILLMEIVGNDMVRFHLKAEANFSGVEIIFSPAAKMKTELNFGSMLRRKCPSCIFVSFLQPTFHLMLLFWFTEMNELFTPVDNKNICANSFCEQCRWQIFINSINALVAMFIFDNWNTATAYRNHNYSHSDSDLIALDSITCCGIGEATTRR